MVVGVNHLVDVASDTALDDSVCLTGEFFVIVSTFAAGQILNFGSLAFATDYYSKLHPLKQAELVDNESPAPCLPSSLQHRTLGPSPIRFGSDLPRSLWRNDPIPTTKGRYLC
jgi:hypothetical protein